MHQSRIIEVDGVFLGAALGLPGAEGWRIVAADAHLARLHGTVAASLAEVRRLARQTYFANRPTHVVSLAAGARGPSRSRLASVAA